MYNSSLKYIMKGLVLTENTSTEFLQLQCQHQFHNDRYCHNRTLGRDNRLSVLLILHIERERSTFLKNIQITYFRHRSSRDCGIRVEGLSVLQNELCISSLIEHVHLLLQYGQSSPGRQLWGLGVGSPSATTDCRTPSVNLLEVLHLGQPAPRQ